ncbi:cobalt ECF transporter T component CbiQ [Schlesneria sp.]|uniref:cobalt ECF transporter T component CbiQ n=1 Tax=Schlesneria sp. TaxID=2762018 RepID=UPI002EE11064
MATSGEAIKSVSPCHALSPNTKLGMTLAVIILSSLIPAEHWPAQGLLMAFVFAGLSLAGIELGYLARRVGLFLPMLLIFGLSIPLAQMDREAAWVWTIGLWLRCLISFLAGLWLIHVLPFPELLMTLRSWKCPGLLVAMLAFMYRYIFILWDEVNRLRNARDARDFGTASLWMKWTTNAQLIGLLLLRAMERAERTHHAMLARGWDGSPKFLGDDSRKVT